MALIHHNIVTGQSLAVGFLGSAGSSPATQANPSNVLTINADGSTGPLVSPTNTQEPGRTLAEHVYALNGSPGSYFLTALTHAASGQDYAVLKKGGTGAYYAQAIARAQAGYTAAIGRGDTFVADAVHFIHGEQDDADGHTRTDYAGYLAQWISDYSGDLKAITGQAGAVAGFSSQTHLNGTGESSLGMLAAHRAGTVTLVGVKYHLPTPENTHLNGPGYYYLGEYHAKAHYKKVVLGQTWNPVMPVSHAWSQDGKKIISTYTAPVAPLVFDSSTTNVGALAYKGFSYTDDAGGSAQIASVALTGSLEVTITLTNKPTAPNPILRYGYNPHGGNLRDSDTATSALDGFALRNYCVRFEDALPALIPTPQTFDATGFRLG